MRLQKLTSKYENGLAEEMEAKIIKSIIDSALFKAAYDVELDLKEPNGATSVKKLSFEDKGPKMRSHDGRQHQRKDV